REKAIGNQRPRIASSALLGLGVELGRFVAQLLDQRVGALGADDLLRLGAEVLDQRAALDEDVDAAPAGVGLAQAVVHLGVAAALADQRQHGDVAARLGARALDRDLLVAVLVERVAIGGREMLLEGVDEVALLLGAHRVPVAG